jgi:hypothetical protein
MGSGRGFNRHTSTVPKAKRTLFSRFVRSPQFQRIVSRTYRSIIVVLPMMASVMTPVVSAIVVTRAVINPVVVVSVSGSIVIARIIAGKVIPRSGANAEAEVLSLRLRCSENNQS